MNQRIVQLGNFDIEQTSSATIDQPTKQLRQPMNQWRNKQTMQQTSKPTKLTKQPDDKSTSQPTLKNAQWAERKEGVKHPTPAQVEYSGTEKPNNHKQKLRGGRGEQQLPPGCALA